MEPEETPPPSPTPPEGGKSGFFQNINTTIAGITAMVVAVGGLAATWDRIFPPRQAEAAAPGEVANETAVPSDEANAAAAADAEPEAGEPTLYQGSVVDGGKVLKIEWTGESWSVTEGDNDPWTYDETISPDETRVLAVSGDSYLRWPIDGGEVDESDDKVKWKTYGSVDPVAEPEPAQ